MGRGGKHGERGGTHTVLHRARRHPPLHSNLHSRLRGYQVGAHWFSLTSSPCQAQASQPKGERLSQGGARALHQPARGVCPSLGPPWGRAPFSPWRDKALLESSWARWHLVQAWLRQTGSWAGGGEGAAGRGSAGQTHAPSVWLAPCQACDRHLGMRSARPGGHVGGCLG